MVDREHLYQKLGEIFATDAKETLYGCLMFLYCIKINRRNMLTLQEFEELLSRIE
jgi:hypothetical protein